MTGTRIIFLALIFQLLTSIGSLSQPGNRSDEFVVDFLDVRDGLLSNYVSKTVSDESNLKYFATEGGISRYDGYTFKSYRPGTSYTELLNENIETLFNDADNNIWIGTKSGGLSMLDVRYDSITSKNSFFKLTSGIQLHVMSIHQDNRGYMWIGTWSNGVFVFDPKQSKIIHHFPFKIPILNIIRDHNHDMWFIAGQELCHYQTSQAKLKRFTLPRFMTNLIEDTYRGRLWIVGNSGKDANEVRLLSFDLLSHEITDVPISFNARFVRSMAIDDRKRLWLGSWGDGLYISDATVTSFQRIQINPAGNNIDNVNHASILDIAIDKNGIAWLSTANGGVVRLYPNKGFTHISNNSPEVVNDQNAISIHKGVDGKLFMGTVSQGLLMKMKGDVFSRLDKLPIGRVNCINEKGRFLFVGTNKGLVIIKDRDTDKPVIRFANEKVTSVLLDRNNNLWIGTQQNGLRVTSIDTDPLLENTRQYSEARDDVYRIENNRINKISSDMEGNIWVATYSGINRYDERSKRFLSQGELTSNTLPALIINDFHIVNKTLFLATPIGFLEMREKNGRLALHQTYDLRSGLVNDFICALQPDARGNIWMSTTTTITRFDTLNRTFLNYDRQDGVKMNSFHIGSSFTDKDGLIYFGGSDGIIRLNPDSINDRPTFPNVVFTGIIVNNKNLNVGDKVDDKVLLTSDINYTSELDLGYKQNHLTLIFVADDFYGTKNINYQYKLRGYEDEWIDTRGRNEISFTGLNPGDYELQIRASHNRITWGQPKRIQIHVDSPPWSTWYAYLFYIIFAIGGAFAINYVSTRQAKLEAKLRIAEIEKEKEHDLSEAKLAFFTNISHEFRTPLTLIASPITEMLSDPNVEAGVKEKMMMIDSNANRLLNLINQLLDFRKSEHGLLTQNFERSEFVSFAHEVFLSFKDIARKKNIDYTFDAECDRLLLPFDRDKMEIVLCNIISNAFKYCQEGGKIRIHLFVADNHVNLEVVDNGIGMSAEDAKRVFDRFYQVQSAQTAKMVGSGIGLAFAKNIVELHHGNIFVRSVPGVETCFTTQLLIDNPHIVPGGGADNVESDDYSNELHPDWVSQNSLEIDSTSKQETVLIVEDNEDIRKYLQNLLHLDYKIIEAENGVAGLTLAKNELPDLIVSDIMMPEMDGITFCHELKGQVATSHIPIILLTARTSIVYQVNGLEMGADDYVTKPFNPVILKTRIHNILENRKKLRGYYLNKVRFEPEKQEVSEGNNIDNAFIEKAMKLVSDNLANESFGVDILVTELCMSQSTLYRKLKSLTGLSITGFIRSVRLKRAAQMILNEDVKLSQVAFEVGFNDYKHFRLSFQEQFGCLPSNYKELMMENMKRKEQSI